MLLIFTRADGPLEGLRSWRGCTGALLLSGCALACGATPDGVSFSGAPSSALDGGTPASGGASGVQTAGGSASGGGGSAAGGLMTVEEPPFVCPTAAPASGSGPVAAYGELVVREGKITAEHTCLPVQIKGTSLFWSLPAWGQTHYWNFDTVKRMRDEFQSELIRGAMGVEDNGGLLWDEGNKWRMMEVVDAAIELGIYVIVDFHSHHAHHHTGLAKSFFGEMAQKYGHEDNVIFEIYNEPLDSASWETIASYANEVIPVIREHSDNLILVGTRTWSQRVDEAAEQPLGFENLGYSLHFYVSSHGSEVRAYAEEALSKKLPIFVTEWGAWGPLDGGSSDMSADDWMAFLDQHQLSSAAWAISSKEEPSSFFYGDGNLREFGHYVKNVLSAHGAKAAYPN